VGFFGAVRDAEVAVGWLVSPALHCRRMSLGRREPPWRRAPGAPLGRRKQAAAGAPEAAVEAAAEAAPAAAAPAPAADDEKEDEEKEDEEKEEEEAEEDGSAPANAVNAAELLPCLALSACWLALWAYSRSASDSTSLASLMAAMRAVAAARSAPFWRRSGWLRRASCLYACASARCPSPRAARPATEAAPKWESATWTSISTKIQKIPAVVCCIAVVNSMPQS
jgi:hypothetical protein